VFLLAVSRKLQAVQLTGDGCLRLLCLCGDALFLNLALEGHREACTAFYCWKYHCNLSSGRSISPELLRHQTCSDALGLDRRWGAAQGAQEYYC